MRSLLGAIVLAAFLLVEFAAAQSQPEDPLRLVQQIEGPTFTGRIGHLALDTKRNRLFIAVIGSNTVEIIDLKTGKAMPPLTSLGSPQDVLYLPDSDLIAVSSSSHGKVFFFDAETLKMSNDVVIKRNAAQMRYDDQAKLVYVAHGTGEVAAIDPTKKEVVRNFNLDHTMAHFELEPGTNRMFANMSARGEILVIDRETGAVLETWSLAEQDITQNIPMALDAANHHLYVGSRKPARMLIFDTTSGKQLAALGLINDCETIAFDPNSQRAYATCGTGTIDVYSKRSSGDFQLEARIPTASGARTSLFVPEQRRFYLISPGSRENAKGMVRVFESDADAGGAAATAPATQPSSN